MTVPHRLIDGLSIPSPSTSPCTSCRRLLFHFLVDAGEALLRLLKDGGHVVLKGMAKEVVEGGEVNAITGRVAGEGVGMRGRGG